MKTTIEKLNKQTAKRREKIYKTFPKDFRSKPKYSKYEKQIIKDFCTAYNEYTAIFYINEFDDGTLRDGIIETFQDDIKNIADNFNLGIPDTVKYLNIAIQEWHEENTI